jgi:hypothetical protein
MTREYASPNASTKRFAGAIPTGLITALANRAIVRKVIFDRLVSWPRASWKIPSHGAKRRRAEKF